MLIIDPGNRIDAKALVAAKHAESLGARAAGYGGMASPAWSTDLDELEAQISEFYPPIRKDIDRILDYLKLSERLNGHVRYCVDNTSPIVIVTGVDNLSKVSLTLAGFVDTGECTWMHATNLKVNNFI